MSESNNVKATTKEDGVKVKRIPKVKIISEGYEQKLEEKVNEFLRSESIKDDGFEFEGFDYSKNERVSGVKYIGVITYTYLEEIKEEEQNG